MKIKSTAVRKEIAKIAVLVVQKEADVNQNVILTGNPGHRKEDQRLMKKKHEMSKDGRHGGQTRSLVEPDRFLKRDLRNLKTKLSLVNDRDVDHHQRRNLEDDLNHQYENGRGLKNVLSDVLPLGIAPSVGIRRAPNALSVVMKS